MNRRLLSLVIVLPACVGLVWGFVAWQRAGREIPGDPKPPDEEAPCRNTMPGVEYVGDVVCSRCHQTIAKRFRQHPMGQSLGPTAEMSPIESFDTSAHPAFDAKGFHYEVLRKDGKLFHRESRRDSEGKEIDAREAEVQFTLGSGSRGRSYLINLDGRVYLSPIAWYSQAKRWDLSPGYAEAHAHFERPVTTDCLFCHCNQAKPVANTVNRYEQPLFRGHAIGCERCHGPGGIHALEQEEGKEGPTASIVQPRKLSPRLRDAVCEQCHLHGILRVTRQSREEFDYRPGLPLHEFLAVFVHARDATQDNNAVSQVEQMGMSKCYVQSKGKLGCISCHDPHGLPAPEEKTAFYRGRCLECHGKEGPDCSLPAPVRQARNHDDCVSCHMPRFKTTDIAHTSVTDHRILAQPEKQPRVEKAAPLPPWQLPIAPFHKNQLPPGNPLRRELGLAMTQVGITERPAAAVQFGLPRLEESLGEQPDDIPALRAKAMILASQGISAEALKCFQRILDLAPEHEEALAWAAPLVEQLGTLERAEDYWRRVIKVNPYFSNYHVGLARILFLREHWDEASREAKTALQLNPTRLDARRLLIACYARLKDRVGLQSEWQKYQGFAPPDLEEVRKLVKQKQ
jgi:hypothetical protein